MSERRACRVIGQPRNSQRYEPKRPVKDRRLTADIRRIAMSEPRVGYRGVTRLLRREGWQVNEKHVARIWKLEGLKVPSKTRQEAIPWPQRKNATHLNQVWSYDFIFDQTADGGCLKWLPVTDEYSRGLLSLEVARSMTAEDVMGNLDRLVSQRGVPEFIRSDNGLEFVARAVQSWIKERGFKTCFIKLGRPWQNAYIESFNSRFRDELLNMEIFGSVLDAKVPGKEYRYKYNHQRPHSSLGDLTPAEFASRCPPPLRPLASAPMDSADQSQPKLS